jgi:hypothetical protein
MTKREMRNILTAIPAGVIVLFYWWATATDFQWQGESADVWYVSLMIVGAVVAVAGVIIVAPVAVGFFWLKGRRQHKSKQKSDIV